MIAVALVGMLAVLTMVSTLMLVYPIGPIAELMEFVTLDQSETKTGRMKNWFRVWLLALPLIHLAGAAAVEVCVFLVSSIGNCFKTIYFPNQGSCCFAELCC